jgi:hypothetical protein
MNQVNKTLTVRQDNMQLLLVMHIFSTKNELPVAHIQPLSEFETHFLKVRHFNKAQLLVQTYAGCIGQYNAANHCMQTHLF